jgi:hypothetical protein
LISINILKDIHHQRDHERNLPKLPELSIYQEMDIPIAVDEITKAIRQTLIPLFMNKCILKTN